MTGMKGSGLSCDLSQPEKPSPTTPFVHQYPPLPHLAQECQEISPTVFPGSRKWWKAGFSSPLCFSTLSMLVPSSGLQFSICKVME